MLRQSFIYSSICLLLVGCTSQGHRAPVATLTPSNAVVSSIHQVARGESLEEVARKHGKSVHKLAALNHLHEPFQIYPGQKLLLGSKSDKHQLAHKSHSAKPLKTTQVASASASNIGFVKATSDKPIYTDLPTDSQFKPSKKELMAEVNKSEFSQYEVTDTPEVVSTPALESKPIKVAELSKPEHVAPAESVAKPSSANQLVKATATSSTPATASTPSAPSKVASTTAAGSGSGAAAVGKGTAAGAGVVSTTVLAKKDEPKVAEKSLEKAVEKAPEKVALKPEPKVETKVDSNKVDAKVAKAPEVEKPLMAAASKSLKGWHWPHGGNVVVEGNKHFHRNGIDIKGNPGDSIKSVADGKVIYKGNGLRGYGELVIIKHPNDYLTAYAHNEKIVVKEGDTVKAGETIAYMGNTGSDSVKLHFEMRHKKDVLDPLQYLPPR